LIFGSVILEWSSGLTTGTRCIPKAFEIEKCSYSVVVFDVANTLQHHYQLNVHNSHCYYVLPELEIYYIYKVILYWNRNDMFKKHWLHTEMADCKVFAMCSASSACIPLQARKSMRLEAVTTDM